MHSTLIRPLHAGDSRHSRPPARGGRPGLRRLPRSENVRGIGLPGYHHQRAAQRAREPLAQRIGTAPGLTQPFTLPTLPAGIPPTLTIRGNEQRAAVLAEALLAEGIIQESDWYGAIGPSIGLGITRWVSNILTGDPSALIRTMPEWCGEMLGGDLERIEIGLLWTDDLRSTSGIDTRKWTSGPGRNPQERVGVLALVSEPGEGCGYSFDRDVIVGRTVQEFEAVRPGLGFQVLYLLQEVLPKTLCVATPHWAFQQTIKAWMASGVPSGEVAGTPYNLVMPEHGVLPQEFLKTVPLPACEGEFRPGVLKAALAGDPLPERLREILAAAVQVYELSRIPQDAYRWDTHALCAPTSLTFIDVPGGAAPRTPFSVRWSSSDDIPALVDDYHHSTAKDATNLTWAQAWQASNPKALRKTARHFRQIVTLAFKACQLAELLHSDEDPQ